MAVSFQRPVGCHADIRELEYLSALAQTGLPRLRQNASLHAKDIKYFLISRHGIVLQTEEVKSLILADMACDFGGDENDPESVLDLCHMVSLLIIPHLRKIQELGEKQAQEDLFGKVLKLIFEDVTGDPDMTEFVLEKDFMRQIVESYGELDVSDDLIEAMIRHAGGGVEGKVVLNMETFVRALTYDVEKYNPESENRWSTHYEDVFGYQAPPTKVVIVGQDEGVDMNRKGMNTLEDGPQKQRTITHVYTAPAWDHTADTYRSQTYTILLWTGLVATYLSYVEAFDLTTNVGCNINNFACKVTNGIVQWILIFIQLSLLGSCYILFGSAGNSVFNSNIFIALGSILVGMVTVTMTTVVAFFVETKNPLFNTTKYGGYYVANLWSLMIGICLILLQMMTIVRILLPTKILMQKNAGWIDRLLTPGLAKMECKTKRAATFKINNMISNALEIHAVKPARITSVAAMSSYGRALLNFRTQEDLHETAGGFIWAWAKILNGSIFTEEGIWLHSRLLIANFSQFFMALHMVAYLLNFFLGQFFTDCNADPNDEYPCPGDAPPTLTPTMMPSLVPTTVAEWSNATSMFNNPQADAFYAYVTEIGVNDTLIYDMFVWLGFYDPNDPYNNITTSPSSAPSSNFTMAPVANSQLTTTEFEAKFAIYSGIVGAFLAVILTASMLLPSTITTILQFRCGVLGSLRDPEFKDYRESMENTAVVFGICFFGAFYTAFFTFIVVGGAALFCVWSKTRERALILAAQIIGVGVTVVISATLVTLLRKKFYKAFYRKKPAAANIMNIVMEAWNVGLSIGYALGRAAKLIGLTAIYLGRIDTPFLAKGVGSIGDIALDTLPVSFRKDLMLHEAHRHPYLERLGCMYMMKLYHGPDFGSRAGSAWRLLFVIALMPWLRKYRVQNEDEGAEIDDEASDGNVDSDEIGDDPSREAKNRPTPSRPDYQHGLSSLLLVRPNLGRRPDFEPSDVTRELSPTQERHDLLEVVREQRIEINELRELVACFQTQAETELPNTNFVVPVNPFLDNERIGHVEVKAAPVVTDLSLLQDLENSVMSEGYNLPAPGVHEPSLHFDNSDDNFTYEVDEMVQLL